MTRLIISPHKLAADLARCKRQRTTAVAVTKALLHAVRLVAGEDSKKTSKAQSQPVRQRKAARRMLLVALLQAQLQGASQTAASSGVLRQLVDGHRADKERQRLPCKKAIARVGAKKGSTRLQSAGTGPL